MSSRALRAGLLATAFASLVLAGQASAAGRLTLVRDDEPAPVGTHVVARVGFTDAEQQSLGSCVQIATGTLASNGRSADRAELDGELKESECLGGTGLSAEGFPARMIFRSSGIAGTVSTSGFLLTEPGPCTYRVKKVLGSFDAFSGTAEFTFETLAKLTKGASFHCTVVR